MNQQGGHFDTADACDIFMQQGVSAPPNAIVTVSPLDGPSSLHILEKWAGSEKPTTKDFDTYATVVPIEADHTLLMSAHMPHAGGKIAGGRAHAIIAGPKCVKSKQQATHWLYPSRE